MVTSTRWRLGPPRDDLSPPPRSQRLIGWGVLTFTLVYALVVQTLGFHRATDIHGDLSYHRGVAYSMVGGNLNGAGPVHHLLAYFGGPFPMGLGFGAHTFGVSFDSFVSAISWPAVVVLPLSLWWLGTRIWDDGVTPAVLALLGTISGPFGDNPAARWVRSVLPSGANFWPVFPRDVGLVLVIMTIAVCMRPLRVRVTVIAGLLSAIALSVQVQFGFYSVAAAVGTTIWVNRDRIPARRLIMHSCALGAIALTGSAWWWWPRLTTYRSAGRLVLKSFPGNTDPPLSATGIVGAFGILGVLGVVGLVVVLRSGSSRERLFGVALALFIPIAIAGVIIGDTGILTGRRVLFLASIPLAVCAAAATAFVLRRVDIRIVLPVLIVAVAVPGLTEARWIRAHVDAVWTTPAPPDPYAGSTWSEALDALRSRVESGHRMVIVAPDNDAEYLWTHSGAQPTSLWLPGWVKLGFPLRPTTGTAYLARVHDAQQAFARGAVGVCDLARRTDADRIVLRTDGDAVGLYDVRPSARWRVQPRQRSTATIHRLVAPGLTYLDVNEDELLNVGPARQVMIDWHAPEVRFVDVELLPRSNEIATPALTLTLPNGARSAPQFSPAGAGRVRVRFATPQGVTAGAQLSSTDGVTINRVTGYVPRPDLASNSNRPAVLTRRELCRPVPR